MMLGSKVLLPPTDATDCYVAKQLLQSCKHSESAEMLDFQAFRYFPMFGRVPRSKSRLCKHNSILDLWALVSCHMINSLVNENFQMMDIDAVSVITAFEYWENEEWTKNRNITFVKEAGPWHSL